MRAGDSVRDFVGGLVWDKSVSLGKINSDRDIA